MKGVNLYIIVFFLLAISNLTAQSESVNISAWIEIVDLPKTKKIEIRGMIKNDSDQELTLYQKMDITKSGPSGTAKHQQNGNFTVSPNRTKILGRSSFYENDADHYRVIFQIHNDLGAIFTDSLYFPERPNVIQKEIMAEKVQPVITKKESTKVVAVPSTKKVVPSAKEVIPTETKKALPTETTVAVAPPAKKVLPSAKKVLPPEIEKLIPTNKKNKAITSTKRSRAVVPVDVLEIDGLIIDETRSKIARDFYDLFYKKWIAPNGAKNFSIYIREEPARGRGAQISLTLNEDKIFQNFVPPQYDALENVVNYAIRVTRARLSAKASINDQLKEEDQMGSGI